MMAVEVKQGPEFGIPKPLFYVPSAAGFDVAKDGRFLILLPSEQSGVASITVLLNWPGALKR